MEKLQQKGTKMYGVRCYEADSYKATLDYLLKCLDGVEFETVVFRGFSGALFGPAVALALGKSFALVRKPDDSCHSLRLIEGEVIGPYIIVDDFVATGSTVKAIVNEVGDCTPCVGVVLYDKHWSERNERYFKDETMSCIKGITILNWGKAEKLQVIRGECADHIAF
jgi:orotate phosphoribosyltransferase